jgi:3-oxoadipate enol-lactonase
MSETYENSNDFVDVEDIRFHYALGGADGKPVLALVNMASANLTTWEPVLKGLSRFFRVLRFDIRGTGKSGWGTDEEFNFSQYADDLAGIMDALSISKAFVLGVAYGARTAAQFGLRHEDRLTALGLFDVALTPPVEQSGQRELGAKARKLLEEAGEPLVEMQKSWRFYEDRGAALKAHAAHIREPDTSEMLGHLETPVLVACGRQDMNLAEAERIASNIPTAEYEIMEMTGHGSPFYRPGYFVDLVAAFASKHIT